MHLRFLLTALFAAIAIPVATPDALHAQDQPQASRPAQQTIQLVTRFDDATISRLLLDVQATWTIEAGPDGRSIYRASAAGGINFAVLPRSCSAEQGCTGLLVIANFAGAQADGPPALDEVLNRFNDLNASAKVYRAGESAVVLQSYINALYGISYPNAKAQLLVFGQELQKLREVLTSLGEGR